MDNSTYKKKREYKRETVCNTLESLLERVQIMNGIQGNWDDIRSFADVNDMIIFGSFVNSDKEKVHDLDICVTLDYSKVLSIFPEHRKVMGMAARLAPDSYSGISRLFWYSTGPLKYLQSKSPIISFSGDNVNNLTGRKVKIIENGVILEDNLKMIFAENNYKSKVR